MSNTQNRTFESLSDLSQQVSKCKELCHQLAEDLRKGQLMVRLHTLCFFELELVLFWFW